MHLASGMLAQMMAIAYCPRPRFSITAVNQIVSGWCCVWSVLKCLKLFEVFEVVWSFLKMHLSFDVFSIWDDQPKKTALFQKRRPPARSPARGALALDKQWILAHTKQTTLSIFWKWFRINWPTIFWLDLVGGIWHIFHHWDVDPNLATYFSATTSCHHHPQHQVCIVWKRATWSSTPCVTLRSTRS